MIQDFIVSVFDKDIEVQIGKIFSDVDLQRRDGTGLSLETFRFKDGPFTGRLTSFGET